MSDTPNQVWRSQRVLLWCAVAVAALLVFGGLGAFFLESLALAPGVVLLGLLIVGPAALRAVAARRGSSGLASRRTSILTAVFGSLGLALAFTLAACIAFCTVCTAGTLSLMAVAGAVSANSLAMLDDPMNATVGISVVAAFALFVGLLYRFWPRSRE